MSPEVAWIALSQIRGMGTATLVELCRRFGTARAVLDAPDAALLAVPRVGQKTLAAIRAIDLAQTEARLAGWRGQGVQVVTFDGRGYPARFAPPLPDPPAVLFIRGGAPPGTSPAVAIVGTRAPSAAMATVAYKLGHLLAAAGYVIVSGLALGVDAAAHRGALAAPAPHTIAVLGSGVLNVYPAQHAQLAAQVAQHGALVAEVTPDATVATPWLVARNRLISALSDAVIIVESGEDGGAMHTARAAYKQGRPLLAVDNTASGNRALIDGGHAAPLHPSLANLAQLL